MGDAPIPEGVEVELEGSKLDDGPVRDIVDFNGGKVGISRSGTEAGELRVGEMNPVLLVALGVRPA
jgi:hypothetical protein